MRFFYFCQNGVAGFVIPTKKTKPKDIKAHVWSNIEAKQKDKQIIPREHSDIEPEEITCEFNGKTYNAIKFGDKIVITDKQ